MGLYVDKHSETGGFTLTELVIAIAIISIMLSMTTISFNSWRVKHKVEAQVRGMVTDFNEVRIRAMTMKERHRVALNANSYTFRSYSSESDTTGTVVSGGTHAVTYKLKKADASDYVEVYEIDPSGAYIAKDADDTYDANEVNATIYIEHPGTTSGLNCINLHTVRINPGNSATVGGTCNDR